MLIRFGQRIRGLWVREFAKMRFEVFNNGLVIRRRAQIGALVRVISEIEELRLVVYIVDVFVLAIAKHIHRISDADGVVFAEDGSIPVIVVRD